MDRQARAVAATLQALGLAGERALLLYPPGLDYIAAFFGCLYAGVVAVPAYPPRRNRSLERLQAIIADAGAAAVLATPSVGAALGRLAARLPGLEGVRWVLSDQFSEEGADAWQEPSLSEASLAFLQYTSGSTAAPRGVMLNHDNLLHNCEWIRRRFRHTPDDRGLVWLPPYHDMGLIGGILQPLYVGMHCYLMSPVSVFSNPFSWIQAISRYRVTTSGGPDFGYDLCTRRISPEQRAALDLSCWQVAFTGAEAVRRATLERFAEAFAPCGFRKDAFYPCYGLAEATLLVSGGVKGTPPRTLTVRKAALEANRIEPSPSGDAGSVTLVGCGHTLDDQRIRIVSPGRLTGCAPGEVGEIWVAGPSVAQGYWGQIEGTRQTFAARLADTGEGPLLRTGDLGFLHEDELYITGRLKDLIILCGRNLYPQDLERTAEQSHPDLQPGCGAAFSVDEEGQERLVIAHELIPRRPPDVGAIAEAVRRAVREEHGADLYEFVLLKPGGIPKTSSGKIQHRACRSAFLVGKLEALGQWRAGTGSAGGGPTRAAILSLPPRRRQELLESYVQGQIARLLRLEPSAVDRHQPLNTLGLESLTTVELKNALEGSLGVALPVTSFLQGASIAELVSRLLRELSTAAASPISREAAGPHETQQPLDAEVKRPLGTEPVSA